MSERSDDSIEKFFRKAVNQQDNSHVDQDWRAMEKLLDDSHGAGVVSDVKNTVVGKVVRYTVVIALILSGWLFYGVSEYKKSVASEEETSKVDEQKANRTVDHTQDTKDFDKQAAASVLAPHSQNSNRGTADLLISSNENRSGSIPFSNNKTNATRIRSTSPSGNANDLTTNTEGPNPLQTQTEDNSNLIARNPLTQHLDGQDIDHVEVKEKAVEGSETFLNGSENSKKSEAEEMIDENVVDKKDEEKAKESQPEVDEETLETKFPRWSVLVSVAPDFSSTKVGRYNSPGIAYGGLVSFRPLERFQISTGLYKASKQYEGYGNEYQPPAGYWDRRTNGRVPDEVYGSCDILEWPILVRYDAFKTNRSIVFVSAGVSSYRMVDEKYDYTFVTENPGAASGWESHGAVDYTFSIGNISAGYERQLSSSLSVQVEPYLKLPFKAIGWSNINLHTTGIFLSVRYTFTRKRLIETLQPTEE